MKYLVKKLLKNKRIGIVLLKIFLRIHNTMYSLITRLAIVINNGVHPKHYIINYEEWFVKNINENWIVLDIGSSTGIMAERLARKAKYVYGIEKECSHVQTAQRDKVEKGIKNLEYICADATAYDYSKCLPIDCITLSNVLEHIERRIDFLITLQNRVKWHSKKRFLIRVPMIDRDWLTIYKKQMNIEYRLDNTHYVEYTMEEFQLEMKRANIKILQYFIKFGEIYAICEAH